eukprot:gnl/Hemi2/16407_TR5475_c0_g1_i1.p1 gnl/Hemi2/16407_TR5475_c0_g1~~gnl/Hemi2/16407_TR5475_c0_g1_i1.p1  ORF type:complete len:160 (-),score=9.84 gnl/Hemi2/16407_TR5475_c0_g1_i1:51-530(-)
MVWDEIEFLRWAVCVWAVLDYYEAYLLTTTTFVHHFFYTQLRDNTELHALARLFAVVDCLLGFLRLSFVYNPHDEAYFRCAMMTFVLAAAHFFSEGVFYRTCTPTKTAICVMGSSIFIAWMAVQFSTYTGSSSNLTWLGLAAAAVLSCGALRNLFTSSK